jgi:hypothetical protein
LFGKGSSKVAHVKSEFAPSSDVFNSSRRGFAIAFSYASGTHPFLIDHNCVDDSFFVVYRKQASPYYAAMLSHILIGTISREESSCSGLYLTVGLEF